MTKVIYEHECKGSSKHHLGKYKHWAKLITSVDTSKTNGFAFGGEFLNVNAEHKIETGSLVVEACGDTIKLFRVSEDGKNELAKAWKNQMSGLIEQAAEELKKVEAPEAKLQKLLERKDQLLKELEMVEEEIKKLS